MPPTAPDTITRRDVTLLAAAIEAVTPGANLTADPVLREEYARLYAKLLRLAAAFAHVHLPGGEGLACRCCVDNACECHGARLVPP